VQGVDEALTAAGVSATITPQQRSLMGSALRRGRVGRRLRNEARYFVFGVRAVLGRCVDRVLARFGAPPLRPGTGQL
jgi:hypothetical protein